MSEVAQGRGRPAKSADALRTNLMQIRFTDEEYAWIAEERFRQKVENRTDVLRNLVIEAMKQNGGANGNP